MTSFSDDLTTGATPKPSVKPNIRAFRLVAAALSAPLAQPDLTNTLLASLMPSLPLVDWHPLEVWSAAVKASDQVPGSAHPQSHQRSTDKEAIAPSPAAPLRHSLVKESSTSSREALPQSGSPAQGSGLTATSEAKEFRPQPQSKAVSGAALSPVRPTPGIDPTVPGRPRLAQDQSPNALDSFELDRPNTARTGAVNSPFTKDTGAGGDAQSIAGAGLVSQPVAPLTALGEIDRLTRAILGRDDGEKQTVKSKSVQAGADRQTSKSISTSPLPAMASPSARPLDLAGLASLYAEGAGNSGHGGAGEAVPPMTAELVLDSVSPTTPGHGFGEISGPRSHAIGRDVNLPDGSASQPGPSQPAVAETLADMVSAILQAQAQRHGVDLS